MSSADRFPDVGRSWHEEGFERVLATLATNFQNLAERKLLHVDDLKRYLSTFSYEGYNSHLGTQGHRNHLD
jgi:AefR-like transcriptional repressor, C-terminal domain